MSEQIQEITDAYTQLQQLSSNTNYTDTKKTPQERLQDAEDKIEKSD